MLAALESRERRDLNEDGDTTDFVVYVHELSTGETMNLRLAGVIKFVSGGWLGLEVRESEQDEDLNGDGDTRDRVCPLVTLEALGSLPRFLRGDCDGDGRATGQVTDAVFLLTHNFLGGEEPRCLAACDANGDGKVQGQVTDAVYLLTHNFLGGPPPVAPFPRCSRSVRASDAGLGCEMPQDCR